MVWGGRRTGAGRKSLLTDDQRLLIGSECEKLWRGVSQRAAFRLATNAHPLASAERARLELIPVEDRKRWISSAEGLQYFDPKNPDEGDFIDALKEDQGLLVVELDDHEYQEAAAPRQLLQVRVPHPKGAGATIIRRVARRWSAIVGEDVSKHQVKRCWAAFRELQRALSCDET